jgi:ABC-type microcin C transport system duplicated ATPase subunit YejF
LRELRGNRIAMIFQEPMTSLNPLHSIEKQIGETLLVHKGLAVKRRRNAFSNCWNWWASKTPKNASRPIRINCPAASANG